MGTVFGQYLRRISSMNTRKLELVSYKLCPYVQRSVITLLEKEISFKRTYISLQNKPNWFHSLSPTGKVPLLIVNDEHVVFESAVICEYLDEITEGSLFPSQPLEKAKHRAWIEYGSQILNLISKYYSAKDEQSFMSIEHEIVEKFGRLEPEVVGPFFNGRKFSMVDAVYAPIFRYFDVFQEITGRDLFDSLPSLKSWSGNLSKRQSVISAVDQDYKGDLVDFVEAKGSYLSSRILVSPKRTRHVIDL